MQDKKNEKKNQFLCKMQEVTNGLWKLRKYTYNTYSNGQRLHNCFKSEPVAAESIFRCKCNTILVHDCKCIFATAKTQSFPAVISIPSVHPEICE